MYIFVLIWHSESVHRDLGWFLIEGVLGEAAWSVWLMPARDKAAQGQFRAADLAMVQRCLDKLLQVGAVPLTLSLPCPPASVLGGNYTLMGAVSTPAPVFCQPWPCCHVVS